MKVCNEEVCVRMVLDGAIYGGGGGGPVLGKYLGTKGAGPSIGGIISAGLISGSRARASLSRFADLRRRVQILRNMHNARVPKTPTLPPTAPPNVATSRWSVFLIFPRYQPVIQGGMGLT